MGDEFPSDHGGSSYNRGGRGLYRLGSNQSSSSIFEDVEMAHDEVLEILEFCPTEGSV
jgi:hypothetical protein